MAIELHQPASLEAVHAQCDQIEQWAKHSDSVPEIRDANNRLAAVDEYLRRTGIEGRTRVAACMRRLEMRIGELTPARTGTNQFKKSLPRAEETGIAPAQLSDFRSMAAHSDIVERVIAQSSDEDPPSRRRVLAAIRETTQTPEETAQIEERQERSRDPHQGLDPVTAACSNLQKAKWQIQEVSVMAWRTQPDAHQVEVKLQNLQSLIAEILSHHPQRLREVK